MPSSRYPKEKKIPALTHDDLERIALRYVTRYAATRAMLEKCLRRHMDKARRADEAAYPEGKAETWLTAILDKHVAKGWVNDTSFSASLLRIGRGAGHSRQKIILKMKQKGVPAALIKDVFDSESEDNTPDEMDLSAAIVFAKKKKLGPYRLKGHEPQKDMARLCRAGFSPGIARKALQSKQD